MMKLLNKVYNFHFTHNYFVCLEFFSFKSRNTSNVLLEYELFIDYKGKDVDGN